MLSKIMLSVITLSFKLLIVITLHFVMLSDTMLNVIELYTLC